MTSIVPFLDLATPHRELRQELLEVFESVMDTAAFVGGPLVEQFEAAFAEFCGTKYSVGVGSGTDALRFALIAAGVKPGEIVITVPNTFIATAEAISQAGAEPRFVDVDESTYNMDVARLREYLETSCTLDRDTGKLVSRVSGKQVTAIIPVHLYGQMADMDPILELAERYNLIVIEDACQAHGAEYFSRKLNRWCKAGSMGHAAAFSFYPGKNLGACGEAGAITTNNEALARTARMLRDHGQAEKYYHDIEGYNGRLDSIQAGILRVKLQYLSGWNACRAALAKNYSDLFAASAAPVILPFEPLWSKPVYHLYVIQVDDRESLKRHLASAKIGTAIHYPIPLHLQKAYQGMSYVRGDFPVSERAAERILSLPIFPSLSPASQQRVVEVVTGFVRESVGAARV